MPIFTVVRRVDAYVISSAQVEAEDAEQAALHTRRAEGDFEWRKEEVVEYDARHFVTLDGEGGDIEFTKIGKG